MRYAHFIRSAVVAGVATAWSASPLIGQDVTYTTVSKVELGGTLGRVMNLFSGFGDPTRETVYYKGPHMRSDDDEDRSSTIMSAEDGSIVWADHESRTYWRMTVDEMLAGLDDVRADMDEAAEEARAEADAARETPDDSVRWDIHVSTDRTGKRERIAGYEAEQMFVTVEIEGQAYSTEADSTVRGSLIVLTELWLSEEFPGHAAEQAFREAWAGRFAHEADFEAESEGWSMVFAHDPRIREGLERMETELAQVRGTALRSVAHFVTLPDGVRFDRGKVLDDADRSLVADVGDAAARGAARGVRRRIGGLFGGDDDEDEQPEPEQIVVMRVTTEIEDVRVESLDASLFAPPAGYTERAGFPRVER